MLAFYIIFYVGVGAIYASKVAVSWRISGKVDVCDAAIALAYIVGGALVCPMVFTTGQACHQRATIIVPPLSRKRLARSPTAVTLL
jgi:hypothetical protein